MHLANLATLASSSSSNKLQLLYKSLATNASQGDIADIGRKSEHFDHGHSKLNGYKQGQAHYQALGQGQYCQFQTLWVALAALANSCCSSPLWLL